MNLDRVKTIATATWPEIKNAVIPLIFLWTVILWIGIIVYMILGLMLLMGWPTGTPIPDEYLGLIGIILALLALASSVTIAAFASRDADKHHKDLAERLDRISDRLDNPDSIVKSRPQASPENDQTLESLTDRVTAIEDTISRVKDSLNSDEPTDEPE